MSIKSAKRLLGIAVLGMCSSAFASGPQTGQINITGKVVDTTCSVDAASQSVTVQLPWVDSASLSSAGSSAARTAFAITVDGCTAVQDLSTVSLAFVPDANVDTYGNLVNNASSGAGNVAVQILDRNWNVVNINTDTVADQTARGASMDVNGSAIKLQYYAQYYSATGGATVGPVSALANFQLVYE